MWQCFTYSDIRKMYFIQIEFHYCCYLLEGKYGRFFAITLTSSLFSVHRSKENESFSPKKILMKTY